MANSPEEQEVIEFARRKAKEEGQRLILEAKIARVRKEELQKAEKEAQKIRDGGTWGQLKKGFVELGASLYDSANKSVEEVYGKK